jgi:GNAT superfamily N-acetyltransferase
MARSSRRSRGVYLSPHGGCPTFDFRQLGSDDDPDSVQVAEVEDPDARSRLCESILRELPEWFGIEEATAAYIRDVAELPTFAVEDDGFLALKHHGPSAAEVYVMGVRPAHHGRGLGTALLEAAEEYLCARGVDYLQVKTLGPSRPSEEYERTRRFYEARGFVALEEIHGLWEQNPCLLMVKRL